MQNGVKQFVLIFWCLLMAFPIGALAVPAVVPYQGTVLVEDELFDGVGYFKVAIVNESGETVWSHDGSSQNGNPPDSELVIDVVEGIYTILLGEETDVLESEIFNTSETLFLRIWFDDGYSGYSLMDPDIQIGSSIYALNAKMLDGHTADEFLTRDTLITSTNIAKGAVESDEIASGAVTTSKIASFSNSGRTFTLGNATDGTVSLVANIGSSQNPALRFNVDTDDWEITNDGTNYYPIQTTPGVGDVTSVTAGTGLLGGGTSGDLTLILDQSVSPTWTGNHVFRSGVSYDFSGSENLSLTSSLSGSASLISVLATPGSTNGDAVGMFVQQVNSSNSYGLDSGILIDNADTDLALATAIKVTGSSTGVVSTALDLSDDEIVTAFALGSNQVTVGGVTLSAAEFSYLDGVTSNIQTQLDSFNTKTLSNGQVWVGNAANLATAVTPSGDVTVSNTGVMTIASSSVGSDEITDNQLTANDLSSTLTFSDADYLDLSAIVHDDVALQGLRLPQVGATPASPTSGEGFLGWDETNNTLEVYTGTSWLPLLSQSLSSGQIWVGSAGGVATGATMSGDGTLSNTGALTVSANAVALATDTTGDYVATITAGSGMSSTGATSGENILHTLSLGALSADWSQTGAFDLVLNNASSELKILESAGATYYGIVDAGDLSADRTYTLPDASGTILLTGQGYLQNVVEDTTPQLGGNLDLNSQNITGTGSISITGGATFSTTVNANGGIAFDTLTDTLAGIQNQNLLDKTDTESVSGSWTFTGVSDFTGGTFAGASPFVFEGATVDGFESTFAFTDPTADRTITFPNESGTVITSATSAGGDLTGAYPNPTITTNAVELATDTTGNYVATLSAGSGIGVAGVGSENATGTISLGALSADWSQTGAFDLVLNNASSELKILESAGATYYGIVDAGDLSADRTYTLPDASGTILLTGQGYLQNVVEDTTPQLGGNLDLNSQNITGTGSISITGGATFSTTVNANGGIAFDTLTDTLAGIQNQNLLDKTDTESVSGSWTFTGVSDFTGGTFAGASPFVFEGATADGFESTFAIVDPTADRTITFPNESGTVVTSGTSAGGDLTGSYPNPTITTDAVALATDTTGNYVATMTAGSGMSSTGATSGENISHTLSLGALSADWSQTGAFDLVLNNASSELKILESAGATYYGILDAGDLSADRTYTLPDASGTILLTGQGYLQNVVEDTTPQLGGNLDLNSSNITGTGSINITGGATLTAMLNANGGVAFNDVTDTVGGIQNQNLLDKADTETISGNWTFTGNIDFSGATTLGGTAFTFEGATLDAYETDFAIADPTADRTITFPDESGTVVTSGTSAGGDLTGSYPNPTITTNAVALATDTTGNYVATITAGSGMSSTGATSGENISHTLSLGALSADWSQTGAFDLVLNNASSELKILESAGATYYGILDAGDLGADRTYTFPDATGTVALTSDITALNIFKTMDTPAGTDPVADSNADTLQFLAGTNVTITGDSTADSVTVDLVDAFLFNTGDTGTGVYDFTGATFAGASPLVFEGATADAFESTFTFTDPTADRTVTFPDASGTVVMETVAANNIDIDSGAIDGTTIGASSAAAITGTTLSLNNQISWSSGVAATAGNYQIVRNNDATNRMQFNIPTGAAFEWSVNDTLEMFLNATALLVDRIDNINSGNNSKIELNTTGLEFERNIADSNPAVIMQQVHASSTGDILQLKNSSSTLVQVEQDGQIVSNLASPFVFEGATADTSETTFAITDPTADRTITFPDSTGTIALTSDVTALGIFSTMDTPAGTDPVADSNADTLQFLAGTNVTITGDSTADSITVDLVDAFLFNTGDTGTGVYDFTGATFAGASPLVFEGATADAFESTFAFTDPTADRTITFPNETGTVVTSGTSAGGDLTGSYPNPTITTNAVALATDTTGNYVATITAGSGMSSTGATSGENISHTLSLGALSADWSQTGAFDLVLNNASSELKILESAGATYYGILDAGDLGADRTYTFPDATGTVALTSDITALNIFKTMDTPAGTDPVADSSTDTLQFLAGTNVTITGDSTADSVTVDLVDAFLFNTGDTGTGVYDFTGATFAGASPLVFEGATADDFESTFAFTDPTADRTITFPNETGTVVTSGTSAGGDLTGTYPNPTITTNAVALATDTTGNYVATITAGTALDSSGATSGEDISHTISFDSTELGTTTWGTADATWTFDATSGTNPTIAWSNGALDIDATVTVDDLACESAGCLSATELGADSVDSSEIVASAVGVAELSTAVAGNGLTGGGGAALDVGSGTGISVGADSVAIDQSFTPTWTGAHTFQTDVDLSFAGSENLTLSNSSASTDILSLSTTIADTNTAKAIGITVTDNTATSGNGYGLMLSTGDGSASLDAAIAVKHTDTGQAMTSGILIAGDPSTAVTTALDVSDAEIGTALSVGANDLNATNWSIAGSSGNIDTAGVIQAGSNNVNITVSQGNIDSDAIGLTNAAAGSTSSTSGLEVISDRLGLLQGCSDGNVLKWDDGNGWWECASDVGAYPETAVFSDTTGEVLDDVADSLWDGTQPNITPSTTSNTILVSVHVLVDPDSTDDEENVFEVRRSTDGVDADCNDTLVGEKFSSFSTVAATGFVSAQVTFLDSPSSTANVRYTICENTASSAATAISNSTAEIRVSLVELGADLAENYYTKDATIDAGHIVSIDTSLPAGVKMSSGKKDRFVLGIVSTAPGHVLDDKIGAAHGRPVPVALAGRVPVKVTTMDGKYPIKVGDFITSSDVPGVGMKARQSGTVVGKAMTALTQGDGSVLVFVEPGYQGLVDDEWPLAGMVLTDDAGQAEIKFAHPLGEDKPVISLTVEDDDFVFARVSKFTKDDKGNYTGFKIDTFSPSGNDLYGVTVHYLVMESTQVDENMGSSDE